MMCEISEKDKITNAGSDLQPEKECGHLGRLRRARGQPGKFGNPTKKTKQFLQPQTRNAI